MSIMPFCFFVFKDILIATPNRLVFLLQQEPPAVELNK